MRRHQAGDLGSLPRSYAKLRVGCSSRPATTGPDEWPSAPGAIRGRTGFGLRPAPPRFLLRSSVLLQGRYTHTGQWLIASTGDRPLENSAERAENQAYRAASRPILAQPTQLQRPDPTHRIAPLIAPAPGTPVVPAGRAGYNPATLAAAEAAERRRWTGRDDRRPILRKDQPQTERHTR